MGIMAEYAEIAERYNAGTLRDEPIAPPARTIYARAPEVPIESCFGKQASSRISNEPSYSFGHLTREDNEKVRLTIAAPS